ncbi:MAG: transcriptional regulator NrdR [Thermoplasmata archaeon]|nr:transcriptional regulator NrdR [Thermoplasmata archaeon]
MKCPYCGHNQDRVVDTRSRNNGKVTRRRRLCLVCKRRFITVEEIEDKSVYVIKFDGRRELYNRDKLTRGIQISCSKRPVSISQIETIVDKIEREIESHFIKEIESQKIGERVIHYLRQLDEIAYVRFASVYRKFEDKKEFLSELKKLKHNSFKQNQSDRI